MLFPSFADQPLFADPEFRIDQVAVILEEYRPHARVRDEEAAELLRKDVMRPD